MPTRSSPISSPHWRPCVPTPKNWGTTCSGKAKQRADNEGDHSTYYAGRGGCQHDCRRFEHSPRFLFSLSTDSAERQVVRDGWKIADRVDLGLVLMSEKVCLVKHILIVGFRPREGGHCRHKFSRRSSINTTAQILDSLGPYHEQQ
jgi:hypothetical protein